MKKAVFRTPNRMAIDSGNRSFDTQCDILTTGNVISNAMLGMHLRSRSEVSCNNQDFPVGHLHAFDLKVLSESSFAAYRKLASIIKNMPFFDNQKGWFYILHHWRYEAGHKVPVIHGAILTDYTHNLVRRVEREELGLSWKASSCNVINAALPYLTA